MRSGILILELWDHVYAIGGAFASGERYPYLSFRADLSDLTDEEADIVASLEKARERASISDEERFVATARLLLARNIGTLWLHDAREQRDRTPDDPQRERILQQHRAMYDRVRAAKGLGDNRSTIAEAIDLLRAREPLI